MACRVGVNLEVVTGRSTLSWLEHPGAEPHDFVVSGREVLDPQIEMNLLSWCSVRPIGSDMVRGELNADARFIVNRHHVPVAVAVDLTAQHPGPERALGLEV